MRKENKYNRRHFIGTAAMSVAAAQLGTLRLAKAQRTGIPRSSLPFAQIKQIDAGVLNVGYAESGTRTDIAQFLINSFAM